MTPQLPANHCYCIRKRRLSFGVPRSSANHFGFTLHQRPSCQCDYRVQSHQCRRAAPDSQPVPLPLGLYSQMCPRFFKGYFHPPSSDKPADYFFRRVINVGREQRLRVELAQGITNQHPAYQDRRQPSVIPDSFICADFYFTTTFTIPVRNLKSSPLPSAIIEHSFKRWSARPFQARASLLSGLTFGCSS